MNSPTEETIEPMQNTQNNYETPCKPSSNNELPDDLDQEKVTEIDA